MASVTAARVLEVARRELGTTETPHGSNRQPYGKAYGWNGVAWCAQWVWWVLTQAGCAPLVPKTASTVVMRSWYMKRGQWHTSNPRPGDIVFFKFAGNNNVVNHVGLVEVVEPGGTLVTLEGNTAGTNVGDQRNGGMVARKRRLSNIVGFARPTYAPAPAVTARKKDIVLKNHFVRGAGVIRLICPVGRASAMTERAFLSAAADAGPEPATLRGWFQDDDSGISEFAWTVRFKDGWSERPYIEFPDGATQVNLHYNFPRGGVVCLEATPK